MNTFFNCTAEKRREFVDKGETEAEQNFYSFSTFSTSKHCLHRINSNFLLCEQKISKFSTLVEARENQERNKEIKFARFLVIITYTQNVITNLNLFTCPIANCTTTWNCYCFLFFDLFCFVIITVHRFHKLYSISVMLSNLHPLLENIYFCPLLSKL